MGNQIIGGLGTSNGREEGGGGKGVRGVRGEGLKATSSLEGYLV